MLGLGESQRKLSQKEKIGDDVSETRNMSARSHRSFDAHDSKLVSASYCRYLIARATPTEIAVVTDCYSRHENEFR